jgi:hypothetical protein
VIEAGFGVLFAIAVVMGIGLAFLPRVDRLDSQADRLPLVLATGLAITVGTLVVLSLVSALHPLLLAGLVAVVFALAGWRLVSYIRRRASEGASTDGGWAAILATVAHLRAVLVPLVLVSGIVVLQYLMTAGSRAPWRAFTPWYYWGTSLQVAADAGYPTSVREWGSAVPFLGDYLPFNSAAAGFSFILGGPPLVEMQAFRALVLILAVSGAFYALRRFFPTILAALGVVLLFSSSYLLFKFGGVRPEAFGLGLAAWALWALDVGMVERRPRLLGIAAVLAALVAASHLPALLVFAALASSAITYRMIADRQFGTYAVRFSLTAAGAVVMAAGLIISGQLIRGTTTFFGELFGSASGMVNNVDQTYLLYVYLLRPRLQGLPYETPPSPAELIDPRVFTPWGSELGMAAPLLLVASASLLAFIAALRTRALRSALIRAGLRLGVPLVVLTSVMLLFILLSTAADTYVPRRTGPHRIAPYFFLAYVLLPLGLASAARWIAPHVRVLQLTVLGIAVGFVALTSYTEARDLPPLRPTAHQLAEIQRARHTLTSAGASRPLVIANYATEGLLPVLLDVDGLLDGRFPYTNAPLRDRALAILRDTRAFFTSGDCAQIEHYGPDYILISSKPNTIGHHGGFAIEPRFAEIAEVVEPAFSGRFLSVFGYREFCAAAEAMP